MTRKKSILVGVLIIVATVGAIAAMIAAKPKPPKKPVNNIAPMVEVFQPSAERIVFEVEAHGVVSPRTETTLVSEVAGVVEKVSNKFVVGGYFKQGEVLLEIDPTEYQVGVEQAKARLASQKAKYLQEQAKAEQAEKEWELTGRSKDKAPILALRKPFLLEAKANMESAEADLKKAQQKLDRTIIRAPYDGMVKEKRSDIGQFVAIGTQLGVTFAIDYAEVRLPLTDTDLAYINEPNWSSQQTSPVTLTANYAGKKQQWMGELVRMEGTVDMQSRVHYAVVKIADPYSILNTNTHTNIRTNTHSVPLKMGTFVTAKIEGKAEDNLMRLPREAFDSLSSVIVSDANKKLQIREIEVVRADADFVYVRSGLTKGDRIVLTSIPSPVKGMSLRVSGEDNQAGKKSIVKPEQDKAMLAHKNNAQQAEQQ